MFAHETNTVNLVWDVTGGPSATASGTGVRLWSNGGGYYTFKALNSGLRLTMPNSSTANGVQLEVETCDGATAQAFQLVQQS